MNNMPENYQPTSKSDSTVKSTKVVPIEHGETKLDTSGSGDYDEMSIYKALRSLHLSLAIGGLVFKKNFSKTGIRKHLTASHVYSYTVLVFLILNILRWLTMFRNDNSFGYFLFMKITFCTWSLESLAQYTSFVVSSECYGRLPAFFLEWEKMVINCRRSLTSITRLSNMCTVILWILVIPNAVFILYATWFTDLQNMALAPWNENSENVFVIRIINTISLFYIAMAWTASSIFMFIICKILASEFNQTSSSIKTLSEADSATMTKDFESIRQNHQKLCHVVAKADDIFSMQIACSLTGSTLILCLLIYINIYSASAYQEGGIMIIITAFWTMIPFTKLYNVNMPTAG